MGQIFLVGKPNSGKSSLFNLLTGLNQKIGNYSGVTVEKKSGFFNNYEIIDLPGIKSLKSVSPEEKISKDAIINSINSSQPILFVANGMQLKDNLVLYSEIADLQIPMILLINFKDDLEKNKIKIDTDALSNRLACPVLLMNSRTGEGYGELKNLLKTNAFQVPNSICRSIYDSVEADKIDNKYLNSLKHADGSSVVLFREEYEKRQKVLASIIQGSVKNIDEQSFLSKTKRWDNILLHPFYGIAIFLVTMFLVFQAVFSLAAYPMDWIDQAMLWLTNMSKSNLAEGWLNSLISDALIQGIGGVLIFIPQIAILFFLLGMLEHSGYLSRISYISDAFLQKFGLSGKSVIPLMSSWACAIPAIMSTRVIDDPKERIAVIMAAPLMTCSARLPVYTILISVLISDDSVNFYGLKGLLLLALYLLGVIATLVVAWYVNKKSSFESNPFWSLELPVYRIPNWRNIWINVYQKTKSFVVEAGKIILAISILLWILASNSPKSEAFIQQEYNNELSLNNNSDLSLEAFKLEYSYLGYMGKSIEPAIKPLGYDWKIGIALLSSFAAREVFVATLSTIYSIGSEEESSIIERLKTEINLDTGLKRFNLATTISLLLFYVFAMQCMSTLAIVRKETDTWKYAIYQLILFSLMAYLISLGAYQLLK